MFDSRSIASYLLVVLFSILGCQNSKGIAEETRSNLTKGYIKIVADSRIDLSVLETNPSSQKTYECYVKVRQPWSKKQSIRSLLDNSRLQIAVTGANATIEVTGISQNGFDIIKLDIELQSSTQSFSIVAWFPEEYQKHSKPEINPWGDFHRATTLTGGLVSQMFVLDSHKVAQLFGKTFSQYFYAAKVHFHNLNLNKNILVNMNTLQARCVFYGSSSQQRQAHLGNQYDVTKSGLTDFDISYLLQKILTHQKDKIEKIVNKYYSETSKYAHAEIMSIAKKMYSEILELRKKQQELVNKNGLQPEDDLYLDVNSFLKRYPELQEQTNELYELFTLQKIALKYLPKKIMSEFSPSISNYFMPFETKNGHDKLLSKNSHQAWEGFYPAMSSQNILNALLFANKKDPYTQTIRYLESSGVISAALVGVVNSNLYAKSVAVFTGVLLPTLRKLLVEDLTDYIENIENWRNDVVVIVPPQRTIGKYVFFPKGPIFEINTNEILVKEPSYIAKVYNGSITVQGILINKQKNINSITAQDDNFRTLSAQEISTIGENIQQLVSHAFRLIERKASVSLEEKLQKIHQKSSFLPKIPKKELSVLKGYIIKQVYVLAKSIQYSLKPESSESLRYKLRKAQLKIVQDLIEKLQFKHRTTTIASELRGIMQKTISHMKENFYQQEESPNLKTALDKVKTDILEVFTLKIIQQIQNQRTSIPEFTPDSKTHIMNLIQKIVQYRLYMAKKHSYTFLQQEKYKLKQLVDLLQSLGFTHRLEIK